jgi:hypothetical protein
MRRSTKLSPGRSLSGPARRVRELAHEEAAFGIGLRGPLGVAEGVFLLDVVFDLGEAWGRRVRRRGRSRSRCWWRRRTTGRLRGCCRSCRPGQDSSASNCELTESNQPSELIPRAAGHSTDDNEPSQRSESPPERGRKARPWSGSASGLRSRPLEPVEKVLTNIGPSFVGSQDRHDPGQLLRDGMWEPSAGTSFAPAWLLCEVSVYCRAMAMRRRSSGSMKWSWLSSPRSICTQ